MTALVGMGEDSWPIIHNDFHKELGQWRDEYANIFRGYDCLYQIKQSLLVDHVSTVSVLLCRDDYFLIYLSHHINSMCFI